MQSIKKISASVFCLFLFVFFVSLSYAVEGNNVFFSGSEIAELMKNKILSIAYLKNKGEVSNNHLMKVPLSLKLNGVDINTGAYDMVAMEKVFLKSKDFRRAELVNSLLAHSNLRGMKYYSRTSGSVKILVVDSYTVKDGDFSSRTEDLKATENTSDYRTSFVMKDNNLGKMAFRCSTRVRGNVISQSMVLKNSVTKYGFQVFYPGDYRIIRLLQYSRKHRGFFYFSMSLMKVRSTVLQRFNLIGAASFGNRERAGTINLFSGYDESLQKKIAAFR